MVINCASPNRLFCGGGGGGGGPKSAKRRGHVPEMPLLPMAHVEDSSSSRPEHQSLPIAQDVCFFCKMDGKSEQLHEFTTLNADKSIKLMAIEMNDTDLPIK